MCVCSVYLFYVKYLWVMNNSNLTIRLTRNENIRFAKSQNVLCTIMLYCYDLLPFLTSFDLRMFAANEKVFKLFFLTALFFFYSKIQHKAFENKISIG